MHIEIECEEITKVNPKDGRNLLVEVYVSETQSMDLFYFLWETWGTEKLSNWLGREGYDLEKITK